MTHQDEGRIEVTIYEDDIVVRGPSHVISGIREIDIPTVLSRVFFEYVCAVIVMVIVVTVRGVIIIIVCLIVVVMERPR